MYPILILLLGLLFVTMNPIDFHSNMSSAELKPQKVIDMKTSPNPLT